MKLWEKAECLLGRITPSFFLILLPSSSIILCPFPLCPSQKLELDLVGCKAWIRGIEEAERSHRRGKKELEEAQDEIRDLKDKVGQRAR